MKPVAPQVHVDINAASERIATSFAKRIIGRSALLMMEPDEVRSLVDEIIGDLYRDILVGGACERDAHLGSEHIRLLTVQKCAAMARAMNYEGGRA